MKQTNTEELFGTQRIGRLLLSIAPPVMLAQLIQALYNIVDSFFVGKYSADALTALTVIYPIQLIITALAVGTGVGVNTYMARKLALGQERQARQASGVGMLLEVFSYAVFALFSMLFMRRYVCTSASEPQAIEDAVIYGRIVCAGSLGLFLESNFTKVLQARGNMRRPMLAQIAGALTNIVLDPILIFGLGPVPKMGVAGAAAATVAGQWVAAALTAPAAFSLPRAKEKTLLHFAGRIYYFGYPSIVMQLLYTVYIVGLNVILAGFSDAAVTVLGLYYKAQSFFFIPLFGLQSCIVPVLSFNYARRSYARCRGVMRDSFLISAGFMVLGIAVFLCFPNTLIDIFSGSDAVRAIAVQAFPVIGLSFLPAVFSLMMPVFFQSIGKGVQSLCLSLLRQVVCLVPLFWLFSQYSLAAGWYAFPVSEVLSGGVGLLLYAREIRKWRVGGPCDAK